MKASDLSLLDALSRAFGLDDAGGPAGPRYELERAGVHMTRDHAGNAVPVPKFRRVLVERSRYDGATLRKIRARKGVGRPPRTRPAPNRQEG